jgi:hypothetical protein
MFRVSLRKFRAVTTVTAIILLEVTMSWLINAWGQVWPNLLASAISGACVVAYHNRHLRKVRDEIKEHLGVDDA